MAKDELTVVPPPEPEGPKNEEKDEREPDMSRAESPTPDRPTGRRRGRPPKMRIGDAIETQLTFVGMAIYPFNAFDGKCIMSQSADLAQALEKLANENPKVKSALEKMLTAGTFSQVLMAFAPVAVPIMANHGLAPEHLAMFIAPDLYKKDGDDKK